MVLIGGADFVAAVAVGTDGRLLRTIFDGLAVHALLIGDEGLRADAVRGGDELLPMAAAACDGDVGVIHGRGGISRRKRLVRAAMAIDARGARSRAGLFGAGMPGAHVGLLGGFVASGAGDLFGGRVMGKAFNVGVAVHATEQPAVERMLHLVLVDEEADLFAVFFCRQRSVAVTGEAVSVFELLSGAGGSGQ